MKEIKVSCNFRKRMAFGVCESAQKWRLFEAGRIGVSDLCLANEVYRWEKVHLGSRVQYRVSGLFYAYKITQLEN